MSRTPKQYAQLNLDRETKQDFDKLRLEAQGEQKRDIDADEFERILLTVYRTQKIAVMEAR